MMFYSMTLYLYHMNTGMSTMKDAIWEEKNLIEQKKNCLNNIEIEQKDTINATKSDSMKKVCEDTGKISGIYKIINKVNSKYYVGSSYNICGNSFARWEGHVRKLNRNCHPNILLQNSWNKYGKDNFKLIIIEKVSVNELLIIEQIYLDIAKAERDKCYNIVYDALSPMKGRKHSKETKEKMSLNTLGNKNTFYGKHMNNEQKKKISDSLKKTLKIPEIKEKMILNRSKRIGILAPNYGKRHTNKTKNRWSELRKNKWKNNREEMILKMVLPRIGQKRNEETKRKMSESRIGNKHENYNHNVYNFINLKNKESFSGTQYEFRKKYNLKQCSVSALMKKRMRTLFGWSLINN